MSHFKIIQLSEEPVSEENGNGLSEFEINDDPLLLMNSDGWEEENYPHTIDDVRDVLSELGKVNKMKKTFKFFKKDKIRKKYIRSMESVFENWRKKMDNCETTMAEFQLRTYVREACWVDALFHYHGYLHSASQLVTDYIAGYIPETLHIGTVFDCHR